MVVGPVSVGTATAAAVTAVAVAVAVEYHYQPTYRIVSYRIMAAGALDGHGWMHGWM